MVRPIPPLFVLLEPWVATRRGTPVEGAVVPLVVVPLVVRVEAVSVGVAIAV